MSRIDESLYRISGVSLTEGNNQPTVINHYQSLPKNIKLIDGYRFKVPYDQKQTFKNGECAFKQTNIPMSSYEEAKEFCKNNNISKDNIIEEDNGDIYIEKYETFECVLDGWIAEIELNQYEGKSINNTFKEFPLKTEAFYTYEDSNKDIINRIKKNYPGSLPSNVGITSKKKKYLVFKILKIK